MPPTRTRLFRTAFVNVVPDSLEEGVLYVSLPYATASHLCACGCGEKVVTPIRPTAWSLTWDGESVTLNPSIGNWSQPCRSHYWIRQGRVVWSRTWSDIEVQVARKGSQRSRNLRGTDGRGTTHGRSDDSNPPK